MIDEIIEQIEIAKEKCKVLGIDWDKIEPTPPPLKDYNEWTGELW